MNPEHWMYRRTCPFAHMRLKESLTKTYMNTCLIEELISSLGLKNYQYEIIEEVRLNNNRVMDAAILVNGLDSTTRENRTISIGLELKNHTNDLKADNKIPAYLGYTDYFFLWLSNNKNLLQHLERFYDDPRIGIVMFRRDWLIKQSIRQNVPEENRLTPAQISKGRDNRNRRRQYFEKKQEEKRAAKLSKEAQFDTLPLPSNPS